MVSSGGLCFNEMKITLGQFLGDIIGLVLREQVECIEPYVGKWSSE